MVHHRWQLQQYSNRVLPILNKISNTMNTTMVLTHADLFRSSSLLLKKSLLNEVSSGTEGISFQHASEITLMLVQVASSLVLFSMTVLTVSHPLPATLFPHHWLEVTVWFTNRQTFTSVKMTSSSGLSLTTCCFCIYPSFIFASMSFRVQNSNFCGLYLSATTSQSLTPSFVLEWGGSIHTSSSLSTSSENLSWTVLTHLIQRYPATLQSRTLYSQLLKQSY